ncbi:MAG: hypothetical protein EPN26_12255 [Rhodospirillales bacterium]|nr:MAG: hypothetical protein EPN26_12255 [Rhodospirillales bacterium]
MRRFGKWTPARCAHWRSLPQAERPAFERWVRDAPDWPALPPHAVPTTVMDERSDEALAAWLETEPFARLYLTLIIAGTDPDRLREMYRKDFSCLGRRRCETRPQWLNRLRDLLGRLGGDRAEP